jgi:hypothetical protein
MSICSEGGVSNRSHLMPPLQRDASDQAVAQTRFTYRFFISDKLFTLYHQNELFLKCLRDYQVIE